MIVFPCVVQLSVDVILTRYPDLFPPKCTSRGGDAVFFAAARRSKPAWYSSVNGIARVMTAPAVTLPVH